MVHHQLRRMGLASLKAPPPPPDDVRRPRGAPPPARAGWEGFLVSSKPVGEPWPAVEQTRIRAARAAYEAGTHEMVSCTTREGWTQLYCRPRAQPVAYRPYFAEVTA